MKNNTNYSKILDFIHKDSNLWNKILKIIFHQKTFERLFNALEIIVKPKIFFLSLLLSLLTFYLLLYISIIDGLQFNESIFFPIFLFYFIALSFIKFLKDKIRY